MPDSLLTKCSHCKTLFRIGYDQIGAAQGEVRCGVCYKVFNAVSEGLSYGEDDFDNLEQAQSTNARQTRDAIEQTKTAVTDKPNPLAVPSSTELENLDISQDTVEAMLFSAPQKGRGQALLWSSLSLFAIALLTLQLLWFERTELSQDPQLRPLYTNVCASLGCILPSYRNLERIRTEQLAVRSHPDYSNVLVVDIVVNNNARFSQPLPRLNLEFYDINGATVAQRGFNPGEYLGDLSGLNQLPAHQPVHLSFEILDPGEQAVNYAVQFYPI